MINIIILKTNPKKFLDKAIKFFTGDDSRHATVSFPQITGASEPLYEANGWKGKVSVFRKYRDLKMPYTLIKLDVSPEQEQSCFRKANELIGKKYDFIGFFGFPLNRQDQKKVYCFEYVLKVIQQIPEIKELTRLVKDGSVSGSDIVRVLSHSSLKDKVTIYEIN